MLHYFLRDRIFLLPFQHFQSVVLEKKSMKAYCAFMDILPNVNMI